MPLINGDFETLIGIPNPWSNDIEKNHYHYKGVVLLIIFSIISLINIISIIRTIWTPPGGIPEDKEWDMMSDSSILSDDEFKSDDKEEKKEEKKEE